MEAEGSFITVTEVRVRYRRSVRYGDTVVVRAWMTDLKSRGCTFAYEVVLPDGALAAEGETQHLFLDGAGKPRTVPEPIAEAFRTFAGLISRRVQSGLESPFGIFFPRARWTRAGTRPATSPPSWWTCFTRRLEVYESSSFGREKQRLDLGTQAAVHEGHLELVLEVRHDAQATHDDARLLLPHELRRGGP